MRWLGYKQVALNSIVVDATDIRRRTQQPHVADLAADIAAAGEEPIHAPTIRYRSLELLCGRDRFAALIRNKATRIWAHVAECDDREAKELELRENIYRRPIANRAEMLAELVALKEQQFRAEDELTQREGVTVSQAPQDSPRARARRDVARAAGVSTGAVRQAEHRAGREVHQEPAPEPAYDLPTSFISGQVELAADRKKTILDAYAELTEWRADAARLQFRIAETKDRFVGAVWVEALAGIDSAARSVIVAINNARPHAVCAACRGEGCEQCHRLGIVGESTFADQMARAGEAADVDVERRARESRRRMREAPRKPAIQVEMPGGETVTLTGKAGA